MNKRGMEIAWGMLVPIIIALVVIAVMLYIGPKGIFGGAKQFEEFKKCGVSFALVGGKEGRCIPGDSCSEVSKDGHYLIKFGTGAPYCETGSVCCLAIPNSDNPPTTGDMVNANRGFVCPESSRDGCQGQVGTYLYTSAGLPGKCVYELINGAPQACWKCPAAGSWRRSSDGGYSLVCNTDTQLTKCNAQSTGGCKYGLLLKNYLPGSATIDDLCVFENLDRNREATCWKCNPTLNDKCGSGVDASTMCVNQAGACQGQHAIYLFEYAYSPSVTSSTTNPSCVYENLDSNIAGKATCWLCNVGEKLCGRTAGDNSATVRCNAQSTDCAGKWGVKASTHKPIRGKAAACVYKIVDTNGQGVCKRCDTSRADCGMA
jgi:hypothetical protein